MGSAESASVRCASHIGCLTYRIPELATIPTIVLPSDSGRHAMSQHTLTTAPDVGPTKSPLLIFGDKCFVRKVKELEM